MIQRIQTIWFFLAALTLVLMLFLPIVNKEANGISFPLLYTVGFASIWDSGEFMSIIIKPIYPLLITNIVVAIMCLINIFNYKKRSFQKRFAIVSIILIIGFAFWCSIYAQKVPGGIEGASFGVGAYLPAIAILFIVLAIFGINKDEKLIRSAERLR
jgi:glucan phosphoethanolaminetransferase (alkaline phosphatase superfamily)